VDDVPSDGSFQIVNAEFPSALDKDKQTIQIDKASADQIEASSEFAPKFYPNPTMAEI